VRRLLVGLALGCTEGSFSPLPDDTGLEPTAEDRIVQATAPRADVLFVIDDSGSMKDDQAAVATELPRFVETLEAWGVDYHLGVVTTDTESETGGLLRPTGATRFVTPSTPDPAGTLGEAIRVGTEGAGRERGLLATWLALEERRNRDENAGFLRPDSVVSTIVISDEDDETDEAITVDGFVGWYRGLREAPGDRAFNAVVALESVGTARRGRRYLYVADQVGGEVMDIAGGRWAEVLDALGLRTAGLQREFVLSRWPIVASLEVELERVVDGAVTVVEVRGFRYERARNAVALDVRPEPGDTVVIRYRPFE